MAGSLLQFNNVASNTNQPANITPTLGQASTAGNLLILVVAASSSGLPVIATPANWTAVQNVNIGTGACAIFAYPNNPGGITSVAVSLTTSNGGACASLMEFSGVGRVTALDYSGNQNGVGNNPLSFTFPNVSQSGELSIYAVMSLLATQSIQTTPEWAVVGGAQLSSSNATSNNCSLTTLYAFNTGTGTPQINGASLSASVRWIDDAARFFTASGSPITFDNIGGNAGVLVGQFYQGMIGG